MKRQARAGFTLIEVIITMAVVALLATLAIAGYESSVRKARRADARTSLQNLSLRLEKCLTQFGAYDDGNCVVGSPQVSEQGHYAITVVRTAATYALTAAPRAAQSADGACATLTLDHLGAKGATGSQAGACW